VTPVLHHNSKSKSRRSKLNIMSLELCIKISTNPMVNEVGIKYLLSQLKTR